MAKENTVNNIVKVTNNHFKAFTTYDKNGNPNMGTDITPSSEWVSNSIVALTNENLPFYQIATNIFIPQKITNFKDVLVINLPKSEHAHTVNDLGEKTEDKVDN
ncbi:hypothetical protein [Lactobacillus terrae]|uniref:hypothetical protein n=1 Tax=Lactobacillus terrae TaxID=2269374 RepID=UPI0010FD03F2|nr:hypothetical protein [Lactobacillus terrae]